MCTAIREVDFNRGDTVTQHTILEPAVEVSAVEVDRRLAAGWYRVGQYWMTCSMLVNDRGVRSTVWSRVVLAQHRFKRSHRKLLSKVDRAFDLREGPAVVDDTREALYQRYLSTTTGARSPTLQEFLVGDFERDVFATRELSMWQADRLVAFSWYDVGASTMQSLIGVYDPEFSRMSLGFTTVLLEIREAHRLGLSHHYTGYVLPGDPSMDYKLRPGAIEYLHTNTGQWRPWDLLDVSTLPVETVRARLEALGEALRERGVAAKLVEYPPYRLRADVALLDEPLVLEVDEPQGAGEIATWDLSHDRYRVLKVSRAYARPLHVDGSEGESVAVWVVRDERTSRSMARLLEWWSH